MTVTVTVDRIEGDLAVLEVGDRTVDWPVTALPAGTVEGTVLAVTLEISSSTRLDAARARLERLKARATDGADEASERSDEIDL